MSVINFTSQRLRIKIIEAEQSTASAQKSLRDHYASGILIPRQQMRAHLVLYAVDETHQDSMFTLHRKKYQIHWNLILELSRVCIEITKNTISRMRGLLRAMELLETHDTQLLRNTFQRGEIIRLHNTTLAKSAEYETALMREADRLTAFSRSRRDVGICWNEWRETQLTASKCTEQLECRVLSQFAAVCCLFRLKSQFASELSGIFLTNYNRAVSFKARSLPAELSAGAQMDFAALFS